MCKLFIASKKPGNNLGLRSLIDAQIPELDKEKDGIGALIITADKKVIVERALLNYESVYDFVFENFEKAIFIALHTRTGTSGAKTLLNVHFFESNGYYFAHNGFVGAYHKINGFGFRNGVYSSRESNKGGGVWDDKYNADDLSLDNLLYESERCSKCNSKKKNRMCDKHEKELSIITKSKEASKKPEDLDKCDSYQFLDNIQKPLTIESVEIESENKSFTGMGLFVSKDAEDIKLIIKKKCYLIHDEEIGESVVMTSYSPETKWTDYDVKEIGGVDVLVSENKRELKNKPLQIIEGVYSLKA